ncbi:LOW QUALITY PROTEIN: TOM1-like protein 6 [Juglans microcarpa x Juglans regia]|uniref:LOW QUALITY PROTEIN: TOM1-like protein 6 n=1 Tax=Juglans microcarpa x Juglans regia TaxID=2249226 RepID=UPI001B7F3A3C|nr:LOW QUALITY PROTEIN: TOM1-like protein 6 [Juglans microcarpa x Juglans regia]
MALSLSLSSSSSSASATVAVDKATSDLLMTPDWTINIDICDSVNSHQWQAKDVVKAVKKRLQHKNPKVQFLSLTLLETMVKNCGDYVHFQIAEKKILEEMIKIVRKKADMQVREKILVLVNSWQEAFGGPGGKHPQYYMAYEELRRSGIEFPKNSLDAAPIFTPPVTHPTLGHNRAGYGMPSNSSRRLDETMATEMESLSLSDLDSMRNVMELLSDMLQAVNPSDRAAIKDEVIVDLVTRCRSNQKKLMQMLTTTADEELLGQGLELNDSLQSSLARHDAIASGSPLPTLIANSSPKPSEASASNPKPSVEVSSSSRPNAIKPVPAIKGAPIDEEEEEEDEFAQLARRHSKTQPMHFQSAGTTESLSSNTSLSTSIPAASTSAPCNALALPDPPAQIRTTKEQDMIDLLSITLSTVPASPHTPHTPSVSNENKNQIPISSAQGYPHASQTYPGNQGKLPYNSYVVPWAQPQPQPQSFQQVQPQPQPQPQSFQQVQPQPQSQGFQQVQPQPQPHPQSFQQVQPQPQPQPQPHPQSFQQVQPQPQPQPQSFQQVQPQPQPQSFQQVQPQPQPQSFQPPQPQPQTQSFQNVQPQPQPQLKPPSQTQLQPQYQYPSGYPPPPWAPTPGYSNNQNHVSATNMFLTPQANTAASHAPIQGTRPLQHYSSFPSRGINGSSIHGDPWASAGPKIPASAPAPAPTTGPKPFVPSYRLFEDLNVFGNVTSGSTSSTLSGSSGQSMVGGRK